MKSALKIGFVSYWNVSEVKHWSGIVYFMYKYLQEAGADIDSIDQLSSPFHKIYRIKSLYYKYTHRQYHRFREPAIVKSVANQILKKIDSIQYDALISAGSTEIAKLDTKIPIIFWTDATFANLLNYYPDCTNLPESNIKYGHILEQEAFNRSSLAIFSSEWAAESAMQKYKIKTEKVKIVPFGANIENPPSLNEIKQRIENKIQNVCKILFLGVNWYRKGGDIALKTVEELNKIGINSELHIAGCSPEIPNKPDYVKIYGYLRKSIPEEKYILEKLFTESHFLILPSRAEAFGIVFCEANANGLPAIGSNQGGIPTIIKNGINGSTFDITENPRNIAQFISDNFSDFKRYKELAFSSYNEYLTRLNWQTSCEKVISLIKTII
jgi:glycosyltransferase involved in cell wall biosynthesis